MLLFFAGLLLFFGGHAVVFAQDRRAQLIAQYGKPAYMGLVSVVTLAGLLCLIFGYSGFALSELGATQLWLPPTWMKHVTFLVMLPVFPLLFAMYFRGHLARYAKHPMILAVKIWAFAHLLANGTVAAAVLFGAFLVWGILDRISLAKRDRAAGTVFVAGPAWKDAAAVGLGLAVYVFMIMWGHAWIVGVGLIGA